MIPPAFIPAGGYETDAVRVEEIVRRVETGERLPEKRREKWECYFCWRPAAQWLSGEMPKCSSCADRWRRKD